MTEEKISQEFRLKNVSKTITISLKKINQNELMRKKHEKCCKVLSYIVEF